MTQTCSHTYTHMHTDMLPTYMNMQMCSHMHTHVHYTFMLTYTDSSTHVHALMHTRSHLHTLVFSAGQQGKAFLQTVSSSKCGEALWIPAVPVCSPGRGRWLDHQQPQLRRCLTAKLPHGVDPKATGPESDCSYHKAPVKPQQSCWKLLSL